MTTAVCLDGEGPAPQREKIELVRAVIIHAYRGAAGTQLDVRSATLGAGDGVGAGTKMDFRGTAAAGCNRIVAAAGVNDSIVVAAGRQHKVLRIRRIEGRGLPSGRVVDEIDLAEPSEIRAQIVGAGIK